MAGELTIGDRFDVTYDATHDTYAHRASEHGRLDRCQAKEHIERLASNGCKIAEETMEEFSIGR